MASGYIAESMGWRWGYRFVSIFAGIALLSILLFYEETKYIERLPSVDVSVELPVTTDKDDTVVASVRHTQASEVNLLIPMNSRRERLRLITNTPSSLSDFLRSIYEPFIVFFRVPIIAIVALQVGWQLTLLAMIITTQAGIFPLPPYNFSTSAVGNLNYATLVGAALGTFYLGNVSDWSIIWFTKRNGGVYEPEMRIYIALFPAILELAGVLLYGLAIADASNSNSERHI